MDELADDALRDLLARLVPAIVAADDTALRSIRSEPALRAALPAVEAARREVSGLRRREHELTALFASARELAGMPDTDAVLTRLVERAHEMLGSDVTYLSEYDAATGRLHVRATYGAVSAAFRELVVPAGRGLVSVVVETGAPQAVSRYRDYTAERHEPGIDAAVAAEGIVSLVGVPLRTETTVLGVLFVAMRSERTFGPEQIALLSALADHASIVLQTSDRLRSLRRSEEEARAALEQLSAHLAERDRANTVHQHLVDAVLTGGGFSRIAETLGATLDRPVRIVDERGEERGAAGDTAALSAVGADVLARAIEDSRASGHAVRLDAGDGTHVVAALAAGARRFGAVHIGPGDARDAFALGAVDLRTLERAAQVGALLALSEEAVIDAQQRQQVDLLADLVAASPERRIDVAARLRRIGLEPAALDRLVLVSVAADDRGEAVRALSAAVGAAGLVGELDAVIVVLADSARIDIDAAACRRILDLAALAVDAPAGAASPSDRYDLARRALRVVHALGVADAAVAADDLLPYAAVFDGDRRALEAFIDGAIGPVRAYDAERGTELLATLRAFVRHGASPTRTARALTFHPNTILQRLDRLDRVLGAHWRDDERMFRISLAVRLDELREHLVAR
jgi:DNA-binding PucR family transcriptional regulator